MPGPVRLPRRMGRGPETLAEVVPAPAVLDDPQVPCGEGQAPFPFLLQEADEFGEEIGIEVTDEGVVRLHDGRVAAGRDGLSMATAWTRLSEGALGAASGRPR